MDKKTDFTLPRLYHRPGGVDDKAPAVGDMLVATQGLTHVHWDECRRFAPLPNPSPQNYPQGALGVFRGQTVDFVLAHAFADAEGQPLVQYVLMSTDAMRMIGGRVKLLLPLTDVGKPFNVSRKKLFPRSLKIHNLPTETESVEDLQAFMLMIKDNFEVVQDLLSAVVQGVPLGILNGPRDLDTQLTFIQGLLALLPVPARFGVTFTTYIRRPDPPPAQIAFLANDTSPSGYLSYDWEQTAVIGEAPEDPYSHFIVRQLRLDTKLAVLQMEALTRTAGWRLTRRESLAEALGWAAKRAALDAAVMEGQPADRKLVAAVLREDPTLSDDLRLRYVRHLLAFTLVLDEPETASIIAVLSRTHPSVANEALDMLEEAIESGKAHLVYRLIARWLDDPLGPGGWGWRNRAHTAALAHMATLTQRGDIEGTMAFLDEIQHASDVLMIAEIASQLLETALPLSNQSPELARSLFLLAVNHMPASPFQRLLRLKNFVEQLPETLQSALTHFQPRQLTPAPRGMLVEVAAEFGLERELLVLARMVEWAIGLKRPDLIDTEVLEKLVVLAQSPWRERFEAMLRQVVKTLNNTATLNVLQVPGPRLLVEIQLLLGDYDKVAAVLDQVSNARFQGEEQLKYPSWVSEVFEKTSLETPELLAAVETLSKRGVKPIPRAMAYRGALLNKAFDSELASLMNQLTDALSSDPRLISIIGYSSVALELLRYHARQQDLTRVTPLSTAMTDNAVRVDDGLKIMGQIWAMLNWDKDARHLALELLRRYTRQLPPELAARIPARVGRRLGNRVQETLQATVAMSALVGDAGIKVFAEHIHTITELLVEIAGPYAETPYPSMRRLKSDLDALRGGLTEQERRQLCDDLLAVAQHVYQLGTMRSGGKGRKRSTIEIDLVQGVAVPKTGVDILMWIGGFFAQGDAASLLFTHGTMNHVLGSRSATMVRDETAVARALLARLVAVFPPDDPPPLTVEALQVEMESLWGGVSAYEKKQIQRDLAIDTQTLALVLGEISDKGDERVLNDSSLGRNLETAKRDPKSALAVMRLLSGYFGRKFAV